MCFSSPKKPTAPQPQAVEQPIDEAGQQANEAMRRRLRAMSGYASTSVTGGMGLTSPATTGKVQLGA